MTRVFKSIKVWSEFRMSDELRGKSIGFVPTMGALHAGHVSLFTRSVSENDKTVVSIFINPTQFNDPDDLKYYPRTFETDLAKLDKAGVDYLIYPDYNELYNDDFKYEVNEKQLSTKLCGAHRQGHFTGVLTVVMKLLNIARAHRAYFGEKDYQQFHLIKGMAEAFFMDTEIIPCPIIREPDGLAMSSRNTLLSIEERKLAPNFFEHLSSSESINEIKSNLEKDGFKVDYVEELDNRRLGAVYLGKVRLIDNVEL